MHAYEELVALARRRRELVGSGEYDALAELDAAEARLIGSLPADPPPSAAPALDELAALVEATSTLVSEQLAATAAELGTVGRARRVARGYGGGAFRRSLDAQA